jgi:hypothetical protein
LNWYIGDDGYWVLKFALRRSRVLYPEPGKWWFILAIHLINHRGLQMSSEITKIEGQIFELTKRLAKLRAESTGTEVRNYSFDTRNGQTTWLHL